MRARIERVSPKTFLGKYMDGPQTAFPPERMGYEKVSKLLGRDQPDIIAPDAPLAYPYYSKENLHVGDVLDIDGARLRVDQVTPKSFSGTFMDPPRLGWGNKVAYAAIGSRVGRMVLIGHDQPTVTTGDSPLTNPVGGTALPSEIVLPTTPEAIFAEAEKIEALRSTIASTRSEINAGKISAQDAANILYSYLAAIKAGKVTPQQLERQRRMQAAYDSKKPDEHELKLDHFTAWFWGNGRTQDQIKEYERAVAKALEDAFAFTSKTLGVKPDFKINVMLLTSEEWKEFFWGTPTWLAAAFFAPDGSLWVDDVKNVTPVFLSLFVHEYGHAIVHHFAGGAFVMQGGVPLIQNGEPVPKYPAWLNEGFATWLQNQWQASKGLAKLGEHSYEECRRLAKLGELPKLSALVRGFLENETRVKEVGIVVDYVVSETAIDILAKSHGNEAVVALLRRLGDDEPWETAFREAFPGVTIENLDGRIHAALKDIQTSGLPSIEPEEPSSAPKPWSPPADDPVGVPPPVMPMPGPIALLRRDARTGRAWLEFPSRVGDETAKQLGAAGWRWSGYRKQWYNSRKFIKPPEAVAYVDEGLVDYADEREDRLNARAEKAHAEADRQFAKAGEIVDRIPLGQPILVGHFSEARHRRDLARRDASMEKGLEAHKYAKDLESKAGRSAIARERAEDPGALERKIKRLEADIRKMDRQVAHYKEPLSDRQKEIYEGWQDELKRAKEAYAEATKGSIGFHAGTIGTGDIIRYRDNRTLVIRASEKTFTGKYMDPPLKGWDVRQGDYSRVTEILQKATPEQSEAVLAMAKTKPPAVKAAEPVGTASPVTPAESAQQAVMESLERPAYEPFEGAPRPVEPPSEYRILGHDAYTEYAQKGGTIFGRALGSASSEWKYEGPSFSWDLMKGREGSPYVEIAPVNPEAIDEKEARSLETPRVRKALEVLEAGGYFRKQLEQDRFGEKFKVRLHDASGRVVPGIGAVTQIALEEAGRLRKRDVAPSSVYPTEWVLAKEEPAVEPAIAVMEQPMSAYEMSTFPKSYRVQIGGERAGSMQRSPALAVAHARRAMPGLPAWAQVDAVWVVDKDTEVPIPESQLAELRAATPPPPAVEQPMTPKMEKHYVTIGGGQWIGEALSVDNAIAAARVILREPSAPVERVSRMRNGVREVVDLNPPAPVAAVAPTPAGPAPSGPAPSGGPYPVTIFVEDGQLVPREDPNSPLRLSICPTCGKVVSYVGDPNTESRYWKTFGSVSGPTAATVEMAEHMAGVHGVKGEPALVFVDGTRSVPVGSLAEAAAEVRKAIGSGPGAVGNTEWSESNTAQRRATGLPSRAGDVYDRNWLLVARVSYNGRVWEPGPRGEKTAEIAIGSAPAAAEAVVVPAPPPNPLERAPEGGWRPEDRVPEHLQSFTPPAQAPRQVGPKYIHKADPGSRPDMSGVARSICDRRVNWMSLSDNPATVTCPQCLDKIVPQVDARPTAAEVAAKVGLTPLGYNDHWEYVQKGDQVLRRQRGGYYGSYDLGWRWETPMHLWGSYKQHTASGEHAGKFVESSEPAPPQPLGPARKTAQTIFWTVFGVDGDYASLDDAKAAWIAAGRPQSYGNSVWASEHQGPVTLQTVTLAKARSETEERRLASVAAQVAEKEKESHDVEKERMTNALMSTGGKGSAWWSSNGDLLEISPDPAMPGQWLVTKIDPTKGPTGYTKASDEREAFKIAKDVGAIFPEEPSADPAQRCNCWRGGTCNVNHSPSSCKCPQCSAAEANSKWKVLAKWRKALTTECPLCHEQVGNVVAHLLDDHEHEVKQRRANPDDSLLAQYPALRVSPAAEPSTPPASGESVGSDDQQVAKIILGQMGGLARLRAMLGAKDFVSRKDGVTFRWLNKERARGNAVRITLRPDDTYDMEFLNISGKTVKSVKLYEMIYADGLVPTFEEQTGWYLTIHGGTKVFGEPKTGAPAMPPPSNVLDFQQAAEAKAARDRAEAKAALERIGPVPDFQAARASLPEVPEREPESVWDTQNQEVEKRVAAFEAKKAEEEAEERMRQIQQRMQEIQARKAELAAQAAAPAPVADGEVNPLSVSAGSIDRNEAIKRIKAGLQTRSGKTWSVTGGTGTAYGWLHISAPPKRIDEMGRMTEADRAELSKLLNKNVPMQYESVPSGNDFYAEYIDRAWGRTPSKYGTRDWD